MLKQNIVVPSLIIISNVNIGIFKQMFPDWSTKIAKRPKLRKNVDYVGEKKNKTTQYHSDVVNLYDFSFISQRARSRRVVSSMHWPAGVKSLSTYSALALQLQPLRTSSKLSSR